MSSIAPSYIDILALLLIIGRMYVWLGCQYHIFLMFIDAMNRFKSGSTWRNSIRASRMLFLTLYMIYDFDLLCSKLITVSLFHPYYSVLSCVIRTFSNKYLKGKYIVFVENKNVITNDAIKYCQRWSSEKANTVRTQTGIS